jgi:hypothetical protein
MKRTTSLISIAAVSALGIAALAVGCGDSGTGGAGGATSSATTTTGSPTSTGTGNSSSSGMTSSSTGTMFPMPPTLGAQIDRMGRPAINTALNHTFDTDATAKGMAKDAWNADTNEAGWVATYTPQTSANLGILDALDANCGNQPLYDAGTGYKTLGGILADDRLWVDTSQSACNVYLGVEAKAAGLVPTLNDCGGRTLKEDVIDMSYSVLAAGDLTMSVTDGVPADADTQGTTFPYLAAPH